MERTEIDELIDQAKAILKKWKKPSNDPVMSSREWEEILKNRRAPSGW